MNASLPSLQENEKNVREIENGNTRSMSVGRYRIPVLVSYDVP
jgi:hypothetical protein